MMSSAARPLSHAWTASVPQADGRRPIRPLASYRLESWRPGPSFWEPTIGQEEGPIRAEHALLSLTGPLIVVASVLISILLILT
ncbi:hypothetical protein [Rhodobacter sp. NSM]|uniref:hypothetical protein n=1 Tax=Rhodobacter sp. NSM TaxID=3457501 RepID=UPI003FD546FC